MSLHYVAGERNATFWADRWKTGEMRLAHDRNRTNMDRRSLIKSRHEYHRPMALPIWSQEIPPPFQFTMFPHQEPGGRGPPSKHLVQMLRGGSSSSGFLIRVPGASRGFLFLSVTYSKEPNKRNGLPAITSGCWPQRKTRRKTSARTWAWPNHC